ncbi:MAG: lectin like domain-containing protein [Propionibacteriaceae bacterium]|nr:lectin like domain-containing protein [Propionibacteriaceae bacterium]
MILSLALCLPMGGVAVADTSVGSDDSIALISDVSEFSENLWVADDGVTQLPRYADSSTSGRTRLGADAALPSSYDLRTAAANQVLAVRDQGDFNTCWGFAATAVGSGTVARAGLAASANVTELSVNHLAFAAYGVLGYSAVGGAADEPLERGGNLSQTIGAWSNWYGPTLATKYPYDGSVISDPAQLKAADYHLKDAVTLSGSYDAYGRYQASNTNKVKQFILDNGPVAISLAARPGDVPNAYSNRVSTNDTDHMELVIGWDDSYNSFVGDTPPGPGAWLVQNSWGTSFGDGGYHWVSYYDKSIPDFDYYSFSSASEYTINQNYAQNLVYAYPAYTSTNQAKSVMYAANVYTAAEAQRLEAVLVAVGNPGISYTVAIYRGVIAEPMSGVLTQAVASRSSAEAGVYTDKLSQPVDLLPGEKYSIVVTYALPQAGMGGPLLEAEVNYTTDYGSVIKYSVPADRQIQAGQSYMAVDTRAWLDASSISRSRAYKYGNVMLAGFANPVSVVSATLDGGQITTARRNEATNLRQGNIAFTFSDGRTELLPLSAGVVGVSGYDGTKTGLQTVNVTAFGYTFAYQVNTTVAVDTLRGPLATLYLKQKSSYTLNVGAYLFGKATAHQITYKSSNKKVATVSASGKITTKKVTKKTKVVITATSDGKSKKFTVYVLPKAKTVKTAKITAPAKLAKGKIGWVSVKTSATNQLVTFASNKKSVLTVDKHGKLTALKAGKAKLTVKVGSKKYTKTITVK